MLFVIIFTVAMIALAGFAFYLSQTIEHGEARFDTTTKKNSGAEESDRQANNDE